MHETKPNLTMIPPFQAKTRQEIADEYGIAVRTLNRWFKKHNLEIPKRDRISPKDVIKIYDEFGCPNMSHGDTKRLKRFEH